MTLALIPLIFCSFATLLGAFSLWRVRNRSRRVLEGRPPPVSVLKPLCGVDDDLRANLTTFFLQNKVEYEIIFGVVGNDDPALAVVEELRQDFPHVRCRLVIHDGRRGLNPKVSNLQAMLDWAAHDLVVISDSNVAVEPDYLARMVEPFDEPEVGLVTSLIVGDGEHDLGATFDHLHLNGFAAANVAVSHVLTNETATIGKSMMFRRSVFTELGGFESVGSVLAEDYVIGRMFLEAGYRVTLATGVIRNICQRKSVRGFLGRHLRWGLLRSRVMSLVYPLEPLLNPIAVASFAWILGSAPWVFLWAVGLTLARDIFGWASLRGTKGLMRAVPWGIVKDAMLFGVWAIAPLLRHVSWRGKRFRVSSGSRLYAARPMAD